MGKTDKKTKHTRKVILLKYKDRRETLVLSKTIKRRKEKLTIKVECNTTKTKKSVKELKSKEKYPIFRAQLKERIVPRCLRQKCSKKWQHKRIIQQEKQKHRKTKNDEIHKGCEMSLSPVSSIEMSDEPNSIGYEKISSDSLSYSTDDEIEALMTSTRKRMKDLDDDWKLLPIHTTSSPISNKSGKSNLSINSLNTLVLEANNTNEYLEIYNFQNDAYSPTMSPENLINPEGIETNNNNIKLEHLVMDKQTLYDNHMNKNYYEKNKIEAVIMKLEKNDMNNFLNIKTDNISIKQELYDDI